MQEHGNTIEKRMTILALTWPIFIETFWRMLFMNVDVFMLSAYSDKAVAAVGLINQVGFFLMILFMMVSSGAGIAIAQYNGAQRRDEAENVMSGSVYLAALFGLAIGLLMFLLSGRVVGLFHLEKEVGGYAYDYMVILGSFSIGMAMNSVFSTILRSYGYAREPMLINMGANILNAIGNYCFIFGPFGIPVLGVKGVAISTVLSQGIAALVMLFMIRFRGVPLRFQRFSAIPASVFKEVLAVGVPNGGETLSYNLAQMAMIYMISYMGTASLSAYTYALSIIRFVLMFGFAVGQGGQILVGYLVGAGRMEEAYRKVLNVFPVALAISAGVSGLFALSRYQLIGIFTNDPEIVALTSTLLVYAVVLESGRCFNLIFVNSLKGAGDVQFPVRIGILSMWGLGVFFAYILGLKAGIGILGVWIGISLDEWIRGLIMFARWKSRAWERKTLIKPKQALGSV